MIPRTIAGVAAVAALTTAADVHAHGLDPVGVTVVESPEGRVVVRVDSPSPMPRDATIEIALPDDCVLDGPRARRAAAARAVDEWRYTCASPLARRSLRVEGLPADLDAVVRVELRGGSVHRTVARAVDPAVELPALASSWATLERYVRLGVHHLFTGIDHVLFVAGLVLVARRWKTIVAALTAFTLGHSVTLCAAVLGWIELPTAIAEIGIALSVVLLATRVVQSNAPEPPRRAALLAAAMGLLHGLGFAGALTRSGLPQNDVPLVLFGFNLGIELGQLALVAALALAGLAARRAGYRLTAVPRSIVGHTLGAVAAMWCIERASALWPGG
jgi:hydrogenase/urease accessory protein HupE